MCSRVYKCTMHVCCMLVAVLDHSIRDTSSGSADNVDHVTTWWQRWGHGATEGGSSVASLRDSASPPITRDGASLPTTALFQVTMPETFAFSRPEEWIKWIRRFERFRLASGLALTEGDVQLSMLIYAMGDQADDILRSFTLYDEDRKSYSIVKSNLDNHFIQRYFRTCKVQPLTPRRKRTGRGVHYDSLFTSGTLRMATYRMR